jgi:hypothetical protein
MKKTTVPTALVGIAGVHYVAAELSRRGLIALPTIRNTAGYDIIVATPDGKKHANIQVKTSQNRVGFWPMPKPENVRATSKDYYVLVRWIEKERLFEGFMLRGNEAKKEVLATLARQGDRISAGTRKVPFPCIHVGGKWGKHGQRWKQQWESWSL